MSVIFHGLIWRKVVLSLCPFKELIQLHKLLGFLFAFCECGYTSIGAHSGCAFSSIGGEGHSSYHLRELKKRQLSKLNMDSVLAPLNNVGNHNLEMMKNSCKGVVAMNFQEMLILLNVTALQAFRSPLLILLLPFLR